MIRVFSFAILMPCFFAHQPLHACMKVDADSFELTFTGYKFTEKEGVSGSFRDIQAQFVEKGSLQEVLTGAQVTINTSSIDAGKPARNINIKNSLFRVLAGGERIRATVETVDTQKKELNVRLEMGAKSQPVVLSYKEMDNSLEAEGTIDLLKLGFSEAFEALSKQCRALHMGKDGVSKTWSDVDLKFSVKKTGC